MRDKVVLAKGSNLGKDITLAPFQRIDIDHIVLGLALRLPHLLPHDISMDLVLEDMLHIREFSQQFVNHLRQIEQDHKILADYVQAVEERGWENVKVVEGKTLSIDWFYTTIKSMHKARKHGVIEVMVYSESVMIDGTQHDIEEGISILSQGWTEFG